MRNTFLFRTTALLAFSGFAALSSACSSDDPSGANGGDVPDSATNPAVLVAGQVYNPGDEFLTYIGIFPEVPQGDVGFGDFREFGNATVTVYGGRVFVEQDGVMQRFSVNEKLELVDGPRFTWADLGISGANATSTVFISATRAYTFAPQLGVIVVWDPEAMVRTAIVDLDFPERPEGMETWAYDGHVVGDNVIWNVFSGNFEASVPHPALTLAIAPAHSEAPPTFVEDARCLPGGPSFLDENGDYYVHGGGYYGYFHAYGGIQDSRTCALRVKAGTTEFDPDYLLDYEAVTGSYVNTPWIGVTEGQYVTRAWDPSVPIPELADDFWAAETNRAMLVDQASGTAAPYPDLDGFFSIDGETRIVDGVSYFQLSKTGYDVGGNAEVVELHPDGIRQKFRLSGGFLLALARVR
ncbi:hypothetical protein [Sorangium sp. So ce1335]|uniref:hypothetical protein n=1 Tax=Sorangium sp. So ce1335 TaxID=3133335 RepID=UPI003F638ACF